MTRADAYENLTQLISNPTLFKHHLACEAIMVALCLHFNPDADEVTVNKWRTVGLLHDADYELSESDPSRHTLILSEKLGDKLDQDVLYAIRAHNFNANQIQPKTVMDWSMYCSDELSGFIIETALAHPDKKLSALDVNFIISRLNDPKFAKGADRAKIKMCESKLNLSLSEFIEICLSAMQSISTELNL